MSHFMDAASPRKHWKIYNLTTANAIKMKLTMIVYPHETFHLAKDWGITHRASEGMIKKPLKKSQKTDFFLELSVLLTYLTAQPKRNFQYYIIFSTIALPCWSKFQKNLTAIGEFMAKKPPRSSQQWQFLLLRKHLKIHDLANTNATLIKLTTIMCLHKTFQLAKN